MNVKRIEEISVVSKKVIARVDLEGGKESPRFKAAMELVAYLKKEGASRIKLIGHEGEVWMEKELGVETVWDVRQDPREKENSMEFAGELALDFDVYINEAFATSHRKHTSITLLPQVIKQKGGMVCIGHRFGKEIEMLSQVLDRSGRKLLVVGGSKVEDKLSAVEKLQDKFNMSLLGGMLPRALQEKGRPELDINKCVVAVLRQDGLDIDENTVSRFREEIEKADVIVAAGVMGKYEDPACEPGTKDVLNAIVSSDSYKVAGGGDIEAAIYKYKLNDRFDWISVGGGAMLEYLATGTLVGLEALK
jgi:phosphoglycerate kinase